MAYTDFTFNRGPYARAEEVKDVSAVILAIRDILLTRPGNYPFTPSFGMNIEKYQFDLLDQTTIDTIRSELQAQIERFIPEFGSVSITVEIVKDDSNLLNNGQGMLGISISSRLRNEPLTTSFLLFRDNQGITKVFNETN
jgi:phage baseplate assembly protein W